MKLEQSAITDDFVIGDGIILE